ncbi:hypothetical protein ABTX24_00175 [Nocardioides sp. NPDC127514]|jgi:hypothetical protein|uniref:hypothetical protein n=1 Tax=unclassified Nocardioides TaxID=2615069 RepID=UPI00135A9C2A|nr:hypothetical protein [Actinomycetota bacterium]
MEVVHLPARGRELDETFRPVAVHHTDTGLTRHLERGEEIVLTDLGGDYHSAKVLLIDEGPVYHFFIGARLSVDEAAGRMADLPIQSRSA